MGGYPHGHEMMLMAPEAWHDKPLMDEYRQAFADGLHEIERRFPPDLIIISAGFDSRRGDPLGGLMLEDADFYEMSKEVLKLAEKHAAGRVVGLLEGGYNLDSLSYGVRNAACALLGDSDLADPLGPAKGSEPDINNLLRQIRTTHGL